MMVFITHCWKNRLTLDLRCGRLLARRLLVLLCLAWASFSWAQSPIDLQSMRVERQDSGITLSASWQIELPSALIEALYKGVPLYFVLESDITRERWYFFDKRMAHAERHMRLAYQPLTGRWRVSVSSQPIATAGLGMNLGQSYDSLQEAMTSVRRVLNWNLANAGDIEGDAKYNLELRFRLDLSQLPRPLQIGVAGQSEWNLSWNKVQRLVVEPAR